MINKIKSGLILITLLLCSCSSSEITSVQKEETFTTLVNPGEDCNQTIEIVLPPGLETLKPGQLGWISLDIDSQTPIWFQGDLNLHLLVFSEDTNQWIEVEDKMKYNPQDSIVMTGREDYEGVINLLFKVDLPLEIPSSTLRVYVEGWIMEGEQPSDQKVSAFVDLPIKD